MRQFAWILGCVGLIFANHAYAGGLEDLSHFLKNTTSATGTFSQRVLTDKGENAQGAGEGDFAFLRPGCFRWHYDAPFEELMVSDGKTLWLYDTELAQVTVKKLTKALPSTPASILFGDNDFTRDFNVSEVKTDDGLNWIKAIPKDNASSFAEVRIAFKSQLPKAMILKDNFGQETHLSFDDVKTNAKLKKSAFTFKIPAGVDVLQDRSAQ